MRLNGHVLYVAVASWLPAVNETCLGSNRVESKFENRCCLLLVAQSCAQQCIPSLGPGLIVYDFIC